MAVWRRTHVGINFCCTQVNWIETWQFSSVTKLKKSAYSGALSVVTSPSSVFGMAIIGPSAVHLVVATWKMSRFLFHSYDRLTTGSVSLLLHQPALCFLHKKTQHAQCCLVLPGINFSWLTLVPRMFFPWYNHVTPLQGDVLLHCGRDHFSHACYVQDKYKPWPVQWSACYKSFAAYLCAPPTLVA